MRKLWDLLKNKIGTKNLICGILGICIAVGWMWSFTAWRVALVDKKICETQRGIADEVFRFHVLANSDSEKDQRVKLKVRDAVIAYMTSEMPGTTNQMDHAVTMDQAEQMNPGIQKNSAQATKKWAESHLNDLILVADEVLEREGMDYQADAQVAANASDGKPVRVYFTKERFPIRHYGTAIFPAGEYQALRVDIGKAAGHNWWCVLYPNLCFLDKTCAVVSDEGKEDLKGVLTDEEYQLLTDNKELKVKWFFFGD